MHFLLAREVELPVVLYTLDVVEAFLNDLRVTVLQVLENATSVQFLIVWGLICDHKLVRFAVDNVTLTTALHVVLALSVRAERLLQIAFLVRAF